jgi:predicted outer membrane repeat protein
MTLTVSKVTAEKVVLVVTILILSGLLLNKPAYAQANVTLSGVTCTRDDLQTAISGGATTVTFNCPTPIVFASPVTKFGGDVTLNGNGVVLDGGGSAGLLVNSFGTLTLRNMTLQNANAADGAVNNTGTLVVENVRFVDNNATFGGGAITSEGPLTISGSTFFLNSSGDRGGAIRAGSALATISNSVFSSNVALTDDGAIYSDSSLADATLNVSNTKFISNFGTGGSGGIGADASFGGRVSVNNSCFVGNGTAVRSSTPQVTSLASNYWGASNGPSGDAPGSGDAITVPTVPADTSTFLTTATPLGFNCPTVVPDFYNVNFGDTLTVTDQGEGVLGNDLAVQVGSAAVDVGVSYGTLNLNGDGTFDYTPDPTAPSNTIPFDGFRYSANDLDGDPFAGLACFTRGDLELFTPPTQTATVGVPLAITPDISVAKGGDPNAASLVRVNLRVNQGILTVIDPGTGDGLTVPTPADECAVLLGSLRTASLPGAIDVVSERPAAELSLMTGSRLRFAPYRLQTGAVDVVGNNTANLTIEGSVADVNIVLASLTYTANSVGVDNLVVVANDSTSIAIDNVLIIIGGGPLAGGGSSGGGEDGDDATTVVSILDGVPLGPGTLAELSALPNTVIIGEAPGGSVPGGDVFVKVIVVNGQIVGNVAALGDPELLEQSLGNGAELFGLAGGGVPSSNFSGSIRVCLRGSGSFNYRDATRSPRQTVTLSTTTQGNFTCANIPNAGTIVLVNGGDSLTLEGTTAVDLPPGCMVTTLNIVNLREGASITAPLIRRVPFDVTLSALRLENRYYYVDYLGQFGWISADFATPNDQCGLE